MQVADCQTEHCNVAAEDTRLTVAVMPRSPEYCDTSSPGRCAIALVSISYRVVARENQTF